jgi:phage FluMu gp28-like protein
VYENLLSTIKLEQEEIVRRVNWALKKSNELEEKYSAASCDFFEIDTVAVYRQWHTHPILAVVAINKYYKHLHVIGMYYTKERAVSTGTGADDWRIDTGNFAETAEISVPEYLFDLPIEKVEAKMEEEYKKEFLSKFKAELKYQKEQIKEHRDIIARAKAFKEELMNGGESNG